MVKEFFKDEDERVGKISEKAKQRTIKEAIEKGVDPTVAERMGKEVADNILGGVLAIWDDPGEPAISENQDWKRQH